jgi:WD40 repeat protein
MALMVLRNADVLLVDLRGGRPVTRRIENSASEVKDIVFSPDGRSFPVAVGAMLELWEGPSLGVRKFHADGDIASIGFSADGRYAFATSIAEGAVRVWDLSQAEESATRLNLSVGSVKAAAFGPQREVLWTGSSKVVTASDDGTARIWSLNGAATQSVILRDNKSQVTEARFSPDGLLVATSPDSPVTLVWTVSGEKVATLDGHENALWSVAWSSDGRWVATTSSDATARIWPIGVSRPVPYVLEGHQAAVTSSFFGPRQSWIVTTSLDGTVRTWPFYADPGRLVQAVRADLGRCLSQAQLEVLGLPAKVVPGLNRHSAREPSAAGQCN